MAVRVRLGDVLIEQGLITPAQLDQALAEQARTGRILGHVLVDLGMVSEPVIAQVLAERNGFEYVDLDDRLVDTGATSLLPEAVARRYDALPIGWDDVDGGHRLVVAMADPSDVLAVDGVRAALGTDFRPVQVTPNQLRASILRAHRLDAEVASAAEAAASEVDEGEAVPTVRLDAEAAGDDAPIVRLVHLLVTQAVQDGASDVHIEPGEHDVRIRYRIDGVLHEVMRQPRSLLRAITSRVKVMADLDIAERRLPQDGRLTLHLDGPGGTFRAVDVRVSTLPTVHGEKVVMRILDTTTGVAALEDLGFSTANLARYRMATGRPWGAVLVTGPTGSGKSTTLYATLRELATPDRNVITIEDPVEYRLDGVNQMQVNEAAGLTFATALRSILRADPDVALVGEIRDRETAVIAVEAALTGHLVLSTLHTNDAPSTPIRLVEMGVEPFLVASAVGCVVAQRLARRLCERCRAVYEPTDAELQQAGWIDLPGEARPVFHHAVGCPMCSGTGYRGRFAVQEVMTVTEELGRLIAERRSSDDLRRLALEQGMEPMRQDGLRKAAAGMTSLAELLRVVS